MDCGIGIRHKVDLERMLLDATAKPTYLPLSLLQDITNCFSDDQQIGSGGFAVVYKGLVGKGMVTVKKLSRTFGIHADKFHKEVECLMKAKHKNIVHFLGYCSDTQERTANYEGKFVMAELRNWLLCFEYVPNGSLDKYITDAFRRLEWRECYKIITGICEGLLHLHEKRILHLDLKPANILLDDQLVPKIADFGLSRCLDKEQTGASTLNPCGSMGYLAPESFGGKLTFASDIYSLGVIIVEILTGEKGYPDDEDVVETWMNQLEGLDHWETRLEQVRVCIKIAMECMDSDPKKRPTARRINDRLEKITSMVESGTNSSLIKQKVTFLEEQCSQVNIGKLSSEYPRKDIKEHVETEELVEYVETPIEVHWQQGLEEAPSDLWSSIWGAQDTERNVIPEGASLSSAITGALNKLNDLGIFDIKARMNYVRYGGPTLENIKCVKLFKKWELKPILKDNNFIRIDGFGEVYKSLVDNGSVTVRKLIGGIVLENEDFANEIIIQSQVVHGNIVRFIGCFLEFDVPILVYEFFCQDSLHEILHAKYKKPLSLNRRLSIAAASAKGLAYMHSMGSRKILHGDFKPANIFVDDNFVPKFSGFGMSRLYGSGIVTGDITFMDPVYLRTGLLTEKSDVYSFGVVMLELVTGKEATCFDNNNLVRNFVENRKQGRKSTELFHTEITVSEDLELLDNLGGIAMECLNHDPDLRPRMVDVAEHLSMLNQPRRQAVS